MGTENRRHVAFNIIALRRILDEFETTLAVRDGFFPALTAYIKTIKRDHDIHILRMLLKYRKQCLYGP